MTAPKRKVDTTLTRIDRARLRDLAGMLERFASLPSADECGKVRIELHLGVDLQRDLIRILKAAGAPTARDVQGVTKRIARDLMRFEGLTPTQAARDTLRALHERGLPEYPGVTFGAPTTANIRHLADELSR